MTCGRGFVQGMSPEVSSVFTADCPAEAVMGQNWCWLMWMGSGVGLEKQDEPDKLVKFPSFSKALHDSLPRQSLHRLPRRIVPVYTVSVVYTKTVSGFIFSIHLFLQNTSQALSRNLLAVMCCCSSAFFRRVKKESKAAYVATTAKHCCFTSEV